MPSARSGSYLALSVGGVNPQSRPLWCLPADGNDVGRFPGGERFEIVEPATWCLAIRKLYHVIKDAWRTG